MGQSCYLLFGAPKAGHLSTLRPPWGPNSFAPMEASSRIDRGTDMLVGAPKARHLSTWWPPLGPTRFDPIAVSTREATVTPHGRGEAASDT